MNFQKLNFICFILATLFAAVMVLSVSQTAATLADKSVSAAHAGAAGDDSAAAKNGRHTWR